MDGNFSTAAYRVLELRTDNTDRLEQGRRDAALDEALSCTFPASDPVALDFAFISLHDADGGPEKVKFQPFKQGLPWQRSRL